MLKRYAELYFEKEGKPSILEKEIPKHHFHIRASETCWFYAFRLFEREEMYSEDNTTRVYVGEKRYITDFIYVPGINPKIDNMLRSQN
mgnify:CR=1 FL=1